MKDLLTRVQPVLFILSFILFAWNMQIPDTLNFDEFHYVPAAKDLLVGKAKVNREHPPLAKYFIAAGISMLGDNSDGWRVMSSLFGAFCVVAIVSLAQAWGFSLVEQWQIGILTMVNGMIFVLARIAMLDIFMMAFSFAAMALFYFAWLRTDDLKTARNYLIWSGVSLGLSAACKWSAIYPWAMLVLLVGASPWLAKKGLVPEFPFGWKKWPLYLIVIPLACYLLTFVPLWVMGGESMTPWAIAKGQWTMFTLQHGLSKIHPYLSEWYSWPFMYRPVWLKFEAVPNKDGWVKASLLIGNVAISWLGLPVFIWFLYKAFTENEFVPRVMTLTYFFMWLPWALLTQRVQFLFYYAPAFIILTFACIHRLREWPRARWGLVIASVVWFAYYYPVLSGMSIPSFTFRYWAWFVRWI